jgi:hypothetical protein
METTTNDKSSQGELKSQPLWKNRQTSQHPWKNQTLSMDEPPTIKSLPHKKIAVQE